MEQKCETQGFRDIPLWPSLNCSNKCSKRQTRKQQRVKLKAGKSVAVFFVVALDQSITALFFLPLSLLFIPAACRGRKVRSGCKRPRIVLSSLSSSEHVLFLSSASVGCSSIHPFSAGHTPLPPSHTDVGSLHSSAQLLLCFLTSRSLVLSFSIHLPPLRH